jgi:hypothetical protein
MPVFKIITVSIFNIKHCQRGYLKENNSMTPLSMPLLSQNEPASHLPSIHYHANDLEMLTPYQQADEESAYALIDVIAQFIRDYRLQFWDQASAVCIEPHHLDQLQVMLDIDKNTDIKPYAYPMCSTVMRLINRLSCITSNDAILHMTTKKTHAGMKKAEMQIVANGAQVIYTHSNGCIAVKHVQAPILAISRGTTMAFYRNLELLNSRIVSNSVSICRIAYNPILYPEEGAKLSEIRLLKSQLVDKLRVEEAIKLYLKGVLDSLEQNGVLGRFKHCQPVCYALFDRFERASYKDTDIFANSAVIRVFQRIILKQFSKPGYDFYNIAFYDMERHIQILEAIEKVSGIRPHPFLELNFSLKEATQIYAAPKRSEQFDVLCCSLQ